jgi:hypothetical protein
MNIVTLNINIGLSSMRHLTKFKHFMHSGWSFCRQFMKFWIEKLRRLSITFAMSLVM